MLTGNQGKILALVPLIIYHCIVGEAEAQSIAGEGGDQDRSNRDGDLHGGASGRGDHQSGGPLESQQSRRQCWSQWRQISTLWNWRS